MEDRNFEVGYRITVVDNEQTYRYLIVGENARHWECVMLAPPIASPAGERVEFRQCNVIKTASNITAYEIPSLSFVQLCRLWPDVVTRYVKGFVLREINIPNEILFCSLSDLFLYAVTRGLVTTLELSLFFFQIRWIEEKLSKEAIETANNVLQIAHEFRSYNLEQRSWLDQWHEHGELHSEPESPITRTDAIILMQAHFRGFIRFYNLIEWIEMFVSSEKLTKARDYINKRKSSPNIWKSKTELGALVFMLIDEVGVNEIEAYFCVTYYCDLKNRDIAW